MRLGDMALPKPCAAQATEAEVEDGSGTTTESKVIAQVNWRGSG